MNGIPLMLEELDAPVQLVLADEICGAIGVAIEALREGERTESLVTNLTLLVSRLPNVALISQPRTVAKSKI
jgi:hypothetical protein